MSQESDLKKQIEDATDLSYLDELQLWLAWRVIKRKVIAPMGNWRTTLFGGIAAALNYALVVLQNGTVVPQNPHDWAMLALSAAIAGFSFVAKDRSVGSQPGDPPTKARIAGALEKGDLVPPEAIVKSVQASHTVDVLASSEPTKP